MALPAAFKKVEHRELRDPLTMTINPILVSSSVSGDKICGYGSALVHATGVGDVASHTSVFLFLFEVGRDVRFKVDGEARRKR